MGKIIKTIILTEQNLDALRRLRAVALEGFDAYHNALQHVLTIRRPNWQVVPWRQDYELTICCLRSPLPKGLETWQHPDGFYVWGGFQFHPSMAAPEFQTGVALNSEILKLKPAMLTRVQGRVVLGAHTVRLTAAEAQWEENSERPMWSYLSGPGPDDWSYRIGDWKHFTEAVAEKLFLWADVTAQVLARR